MQTAPSLAELVKEFRKWSAEYMRAMNPHLYYAGEYDAYAWKYARERRDAAYAACRAAGIDPVGL